MATFGLWYFSWDGEYHKSRLKESVEDKEGTADWSDFKRRGFNYAIAEGLAGVSIQYTGNGKLDGETFAEDVFRVIHTIPLYVTIPYYQYRSSEPRDNPRGSHKYWSDWIEGVLKFAGSNLKGFYWSLENGWMFANYRKNKDPQINPQTIEILSDIVHSYGLKFIWAPYARTTERDNTDIPSIHRDGLFDYIFVQPNYYQYLTIATESNKEIPYTYSELKEYIRWIHNNGLYITMEADEGVITGCGKCRQCTLNSPEECKELASHYIKAQKEILGRKFYHRLYYFGVSLEVIDSLNSYCQVRLGEKYL